MARFVYKLLVEYQNFVFFFSRMPKRVLLQQAQLGTRACELENSNLGKRKACSPLHSLVLTPRSVCKDSTLASMTVRQKAQYG
jgi:hypothetical protein